MRISELNWMQVRDHALQNDTAVLPLGSTEQHAYLSLCVDAILAERVAVEAAEPLNVPVFPVINYGLTPSFVDFPGTVTLRLSTLCALVTDVLDGIARAGYRRIVIVNGHGGNGPAHGAVQQWLDANRGVQVKWHNWWGAPATWAKVTEIDEVASHASWMESFPWTRPAHVRVPSEAKAMIDRVLYQQLDPGAKRELIGDGNFGGAYQRSDEDMLALWQVAVEETRAIIADGWA